MNCPVCGGDTTVKDCIRDSRSVYRRRKCLVCDRSFYTSEEISSMAEKNFRVLKAEYNHNIRGFKERRPKGKKSKGFLL